MPSSQRTATIKKMQEIVARIKPPVDHTGDEWWLTCTVDRFMHYLTELEQQQAKERIYEEHRF